MLCYTALFCITSGFCTSHVCKLALTKFIWGRNHCFFFCNLSILLVVWIYDKVFHRFIHKTAMIAIALSIKLGYGMHMSFLRFNLLDVARGAPRYRICAHAPAQARGTRTQAKGSSQCWHREIGGNILGNTGNICSIFQ